MEGKFQPDISLLFEPDQCWTKQTGLEVEDTIVNHTCNGLFRVPVWNRGNETLIVPKGVSVGRVQELPDAERPMPMPQRCPDPQVSAIQPTDPCSSERRTWLTARFNITESLSTDESEKLLECALQHHKVFAVGDRERGEVVGVEHSIDTGDSTPIRQVPRRVPFAVRGEMTKLVQEMLRDEVIQESASPWASPVVLVRKKDGTLRFCVDYRRLNAVTHKDTFPLPRIDDLLDQMEGKKIFSTLDAKRGYWQIKVQEESREKTAFVTFDGLYELR